VNVVSVRNVENVSAVGTDSDQITILGNASGVTTVTAGGGADIITASADADHFRFAVIGDSVAVTGQNDTINGFDAAEDQFVFDHIPGTSFNWELTNIGGINTVRVDFNGDASGNFGWDMQVALNGLVGTLTNANFNWIT